MRSISTSILVLALLVAPAAAWGHGFQLSLNYDSNLNPSSFTVASESAFLDEMQLNAGPNNLFLDEFAGAPSNSTSGTYYPTIEGFAFNSGSWPAYTATYNIISPLYFSNGVSPCMSGNGPALAQPAPAGTNIDMFDLWVGDPGHPGAAAGDVYINGNTAFSPGFGVSLLDPHEMEKDLYIGTGPTYGEYGFAFDVTVRFANGTTLTSGPLVDAFAISDPALGDFSDNAPVAQQDAATLAIYKAATSLNWKNNTGPGPFNWSDASQWAAGVAPTGANTDQLTFGVGASASYTATINGAQTPWTANSLTFVNAANVVGTIRGASGASLVLAGSSPSITQLGAGSAVIGAPIQFASDVWIGGNGTGTLYFTDGLTLASGVVLDQCVSGIVEIDAAPTLDSASALHIGSGTLRFVATSGAATIGSGVTATISAGATLELAGSVSSLSSSVNITNDSQSLGTGGLHITGTNQQVGRIAGTGNVVVAAGASLTAYQLVQNSLTIHGTGTTAATAGSVSLLPSGSGSIGNPTGPNNINFSSNLISLSIDNNGAAIGSGNTVYYGTLDIGNNGLVIAYGSGPDPYASLDDMVRSGFDNAHWDGTGITSSLARAAATSSTPLNIGLIDFTPGQHGDRTFIVFEGQTITTNAVLLRLTYMDDLSMYGDMSPQDAASDALLFAANYGTGTTWSTGDLTHNGMIDSQDALYFAANYATGLSPLDGTTGAAVVFGGNTAAVPEPPAGLLAWLGGAGLGLGVLARPGRGQSNG